MCLITFLTTLTEDQENRARRNGERLPAYAGPARQAWRKKNGEWSMGVRALFRPRFIVAIRTVVNHSTIYGYLPAC